MGGGKAGFIGKTSRKARVQTLRGRQLLEQAALALQFQGMVGKVGSRPRARRTPDGTARSWDDVDFDARGLIAGDCNVRRVRRRLRRRQVEFCVGRNARVLRECVSVVIEGARF